jgi:transposase
MNQDQRTHVRTDITRDGGLYMAMELSDNTWKLAMRSESSKVSRYNVRARDLKGVLDKMRRAKRRFDLADDSWVVSCYEAGRDGFWLHRWLSSEGIDNKVIDPASVEVSRRKRRTKTDRLDAEKLLSSLMRYEGGENNVWAVVRVPTVEEEDRRRLHRELHRLKKERTGHTNRIRSLLILHGVEMVGRVRSGRLRAELDEFRCWDKKGVPPSVKAELKREASRLELVEEQILELNREQRQALKEPATESLRKVESLGRLRGIGTQSAWVFVHEVFGWRKFRNRRQLGAFAGLTGTPYASGNSERDQGISKAGNWRVRTMIVEVAWCWLRFQPRSKLSLWFQDRFAGGGKRMRRKGIVAMARRLLIDLWRYVEFGEVPAGAQLV